MANDPSTLHHDVIAMQPEWQIVEALMGGTLAMRAAGEIYLPRWPKEQKDTDGYDPYLFRLKTSTLLPAFQETVRNNVSRVFAEPVQLSDDVPPAIRDLSDNIDRQGNNLQVWAQAFFSRALASGMCHVLVDFPVSANQDGTPKYRTKADELAAGVRPYAIIIKPDQVIGWRSDTRNDRQALTQFRYMESVEEQDPENEFATKAVNQIRVLEPGRWRTFRKAKESWVEHEAGETSLQEIPLVTLYTNRTGFMTAKPFLMELAHLNIKHWQSQSDQDNILHVARVPVLAAVGVEDRLDAAGNLVPWTMTIGTSSATSLPQGGDLKYVEHTGSAVEAGRQSLQDLVQDMRMAGAKLLQKDKQQTKTATQAKEESAAELSPLESMAGMLQDALNQVFHYFAMFLSEKNGGTVTVRGNFDIDFAAEQNQTLLKSMTDASYLSKQTLFEEVQRRGGISADRTWGEEKYRIESEGPALGTMEDNDDVGAAAQ